MKRVACMRSRPSMRRHKSNGTKVDQTQRTEGQRVTVSATNHRERSLIRNNLTRDLHQDYKLNHHWVTNIPTSGFGQTLTILEGAKTQGHLWLISSACYSGAANKQESTPLKLATSLSI